MGLITSAAGSILGKAIFSLLDGPSRQGVQDPRPPAFSILSEKYGLEKPGRTVATEHISPSVGIFHTYSTVADWEARGWVDAFEGQLDLIRNAERPSDSVREACTDLALFFLVVENATPFEGARDFIRSETWRSLVEMGRGRGEGYALRLIQNELADFEEIYRNGPHYREDGLAL